MKEGVQGQVLQCRGDVAWPGGASQEPGAMLMPSFHSISH